MKTDEYVDIKQTVIEMGYGHEIKWAEDLQECNAPYTFWLEYTWVVVNSGMKNQIARTIFERILKAHETGRDIAEVFGHKGKVHAIKEACVSRERLFDQYRVSQDKLTFLGKLPWIGPITKYHLAKNLGMDIAKPDRHLIRLAEYYGTTVQGLCESLSQATGDRIAIVDLVLWRACNLGIINSREMKENEGVFPDTEGPV